MSSNLLELVILRHGEAGSAIRDYDRTLTEKGVRQIKSQCHWLSQQGYYPQLILHSPYQRTCETALLVKQYFPDTPLQAEPLLTPDADPALTSALLLSLDKTRIIIVSHMPMVAYLTSSFLPDKELFGYPVGGLCWLRICEENHSAQLQHRRSCD